MLINNFIRENCIYVKIECFFSLQYYFEILAKNSIFIQTVIQASKIEIINAKKWKSMLKTT